jgi:prepilin-type N-terminal cleavage/methylation domain-containing protein
VSPEHIRLALPVPPGGEAGFTLVEMLVALAVGLIVFAAVLQLAVVGAHKQRDVADRADQLDRARVGEEGLVRDLRHARTVTVTNTQSLTFTAQDGTAITFACSSATKSCSRGPRPVITGVTNTDVFSASQTTNPPYVGIKMVVAQAGRTSITLTDGVGLRNVTLGQ